MGTPRELLARAIQLAGLTPWLAPRLRQRARRFEEASVVRIRSGYLAGAYWVRYQRYVNGYWLGHYELELQRALATHLPPGDVFYDVGANAGFFSLLAATLVDPTGHVFAFDPLDLNAQAIASQRDMNGLRNMSVVQKAVGAATGTAAFTYDPEGPATAHLVAAGRGRVAARAYHLPGCLRPDLAPAIAHQDRRRRCGRGGAARSHQRPRRQPTLIIELHGPDIANRVHAQLQARGYVIQPLRDSRVPSFTREQLHVLASPAA